MEHFIDELQEHSYLSRQLNKGTISVEGIIRAEVGSMLGTYVNAGTSVKGWTEGISQKKQHIDEYAQETIEWLKDADRRHRRLDLDENAFWNWFKVKEYLWWRYYFLLNDVMYEELVDAIKKGNNTAIEKWAGMNIDLLFISPANYKDGQRLGKDMEKYKKTRDHLENLRSISDLIVVVETYRSRANKVFDMLDKRERAIKGFPFQLMLKGMSDLDSVVKQIVRLSI